MLAVGVLPLDVNRRYIETVDMNAALTGAGAVLVRDVTESLRESDTRFSSWEHLAIWLTEHGVSEASASKSSDNFVFRPPTDS